MPSSLARGTKLFIEDLYNALDAHSVVGVLRASGSDIDAHDRRAQPRRSPHLALVGVDLRLPLGFVRLRQVAFDHIAGHDTAGTLDRRLHFVDEPIVDRLEEHVVVGNPGNALLLVERRDREHVELAGADQIAVAIGLRRQNVAALQLRILGRCERNRISERQISLHFIPVVL